MTVTERGSEPGGISSAFSCTRSVCQSTKRDVPTSSCQPSRFVQPVLEHAGGSVYLNCCSMAFESMPHSLQWKRP